MASQKSFKKRRRKMRKAYRDSIYDWIVNEPPRWRIFAHMRWKRSKPTPPKCYKRGGY